MAAHPRRGKRWSERSRAERYALIQSQLLFWVLYAVVIYLVATHLGVWVAVFVFGGGLLAAGGGFLIAIRRARRRGRR